MSVSLKSLPADVLLIVFRHVACVHDQRSFIRAHKKLWQLMRTRREYSVLRIQCLKINYQEYSDTLIKHPTTWGRAVCDMCYTCVGTRNYGKHCMQKCVRRVDYKWRKFSMIYLMLLFERRYNAQQSAGKTRSIISDPRWCVSVYNIIAGGSVPCTISEHIDHNKSSAYRCLWCGVVQCHSATHRCPVVYYCDKLNISHREIK